MRYPNVLRATGMRGNFFENRQTSSVFGTRFEKDIKKAALSCLRIELRFLLVSG